MYLCFRYQVGVRQEHAQVQYWKPVDVPKMKLFVGIILNMGLMKKHCIESYWNVISYSQDTSMFCKVFMVRTFKLMLRLFHASDSDLESKRGTDMYDPTYRFKQVLEFFNRTWSREYQLHRDIYIDKSIVGFKGRHVLVNYIRRKKHHQWGPK